MKAALQNILFGLACAALPGLCLGQAPAVDSPTLQLDIAHHASVYRQTSENEILGEKETTGTAKLSGQRFSGVLNVAGFDFELGALSLRDSEGSYWNGRRDVFASVGLRFASIPWIVPTLGYHSIQQDSDRSATDAPLAFVDDAAAWTFGLKSEFNPWMFGGGYGVVVHTRYQYLSSGEAGKNYGSTGQVALGCALLNGSTQAGFTIGYARDDYNATRVDSATNLSRNVVSRLTSTSMALFLRF